MKKIIISGVDGFIGGNLFYSLFNLKDCEVIGLSRAQRIRKNIINIDLIDFNELKKIAKNIPGSDYILVHAAAATDNKKNQPNSYSDNKVITKNLIEAFGKKISQFIFLSSISVYEISFTSTSINTNQNRRPYDNYGLSKLNSEKEIENSLLLNYDILRLSPVYDLFHLTDIKKRVFFPFTPLIMRIIPEPLYSLCSINTVIKFIINKINQGPNGKNYHNVCDKTPYKQSALFKFFPHKLTIPTPKIIITPLFFISYLLPPKIGYKIRSTYWKLFETNVYQ